MHCTRNETLQYKPKYDLNTKTCFDGISKNNWNNHRKIGNSRIIIGFYKTYKKMISSQDFSDQSKSLLEQISGLSKDSQDTKKLNIQASKRSLKIFLIS